MLYCRLNTVHHVSLTNSDRSLTFKCQRCYTADWTLFIMWVWRTATCRWHLNVKDMNGEKSHCLASSIYKQIPQYSREMAFFSVQFLRDVLFFAVGGVSTVAILKIWENRESLLREIRRRFDSNETRQPEEHDERFDWEGKSSVSYENILSKSDRIIVISEKLYDTRKQWLLRQRHGKCFIIFYFFYNSSR